MPCVWWPVVCGMRGWEDLGKVRLQLKLAYIEGTCAVSAIPAQSRVSRATRVCAFSAHCWCLLFQNLVTNSLPKPSFVELKNLKLFPVRSLVSLEVDWITKWLSPLNYWFCLNNFNIPTTVSLPETVTAWRGCGPQSCYKHHKAGVWVALARAERSTENIFQGIFGFNCTSSAEFVKRVLRSPAQCIK